jgi:hypothetical protein
MSSTSSESESPTPPPPKRTPAKRRTTRKEKEPPAPVATPPQQQLDDISLGTADILSLDQTYFVLSQFLTTANKEKNITTILSEINDKLGRLLELQALRK